MRRWLARLSMSFLVVAFVLFWQGYTIGQAEGTTGRVAAAYVGGALCAAIGLAGVRERHRSDV